MKYPERMRNVERNAAINRLRREARERWSLASPARQTLYISLRLKGATPEDAIARAGGTNKVAGVQTSIGFIPDPKTWTEDPPYGWTLDAQIARIGHLAGSAWATYLTEAAYLPWSPPLQLLLATAPPATSPDGTLTPRGRYANL